jgi:CBS domain-containing protein
MKAIRHIIEGREVLAVEADRSVLDAAGYMADRVIGAVPVLDDGRVVGMFTERDLMTRVVVPGKDPSRIPVRDVMTRDVVTAHPDERYAECIRKMTRVHCRHLPVVEDDRLLGTVSLRDLLAVNLEERESELRHLTEYVQSVPPGMERSDRI